MKDSEAMRATAAYFREHGFSPDLGYFGVPRCFIGASPFGIIPDELLDIVGPLAQIGLIAHGWTGVEASQDAAAACEIAADICESEGR